MIDFTEEQFSSLAGAEFDQRPIDFSSRIVQPNSLKFERLKDPENDC
jgi:hypothetical protein